MIRVMKKIEEIPRENCRERVEKYFTYQRMVDDYEKIYYEILKENSKL